MEGDGKDHIETSAVQCLQYALKNEPTIHYSDCPSLSAHMGMDHSTYRRSPVQPPVSPVKGPLLEGKVKDLSLSPCRQHLAWMGEWV